MLQCTRARLAGAGAIVALCTLLASTTAQAFEIKKTTSGLPVHWESGAAVVFETDPSIEALTPEAPAAIRAAAESWSTLEGAPGVSVQPAAGPSQPGYDGKNTVYYYPQGYPLAGDALAITILTYDDTDGSILDADIVYNGIYPFATLPTGAEPTPTAIPVSNDGESLAGELGDPGGDAFDVVHVGAHEMGHALGMNDETVTRSSLMYLYSFPGAASPRAPTNDDLDGLVDLYSGSGRGCSSSVAAFGRPRVPPPALIALVGAMLGWILVGRRRRAGRSLLVAGSFAVVIAVPRIMPVASRTADTTARVVSTHLVEGDSPWRTEISLASSDGTRTMTVLGGRRGTIVQEIGGVEVPRVGDELDVSSGRVSRHALESTP
jgi:hypothetical protein